MTYYIGADLGTSALKLLLTDEEGVIVKSVSRSYDVFYPQSGWSEQNPEDWWCAFTDGVRELRAGYSPIGGIAVAGQMHGLVALDAEDRVIRPAILWNDGRTGKETAWLNEVVGKEKLAEWTSNIAFAGFTAPKILWMKENEPENFARIAKIMLPKDYINYKLTGVHATDLSDAAGMLLLDVKNRAWSAPMLEVCGIDEGVMPRLFESYERIGSVLPEVACALGLDGCISVAAGAGDNAAAAVGTGTVGEGKCNISIGTSGTVFLPAREAVTDENNALHTFCHSDGTYHLLACILSAASCNEWFCRRVLGTEEYAKEQAAITDGMLGETEALFLPYLMGERSPVNDVNATGMFLGLRPNTSREEMVLAVLEGVAFAVKDNLEVAKKLGIAVEESTLCGGGAKSPLWRRILANVLGITLKLPACEEGPGYGAAMLAMVAEGKYESVSACAEKFARIRGEVKPEEAIVARYAKKYEKYKKLYPALKGLYKDLKEN